MSLIAWYPLNGDTKDYSVSKIHGTISGTLSMDNNGKIGKTFLFKNDDSGVNVNRKIEGLSEYTMCAWINPAGNHKNYNGTVISSGNWNNSCWTFGVNQTNTAIDVASSGYNKYINYNIPLNSWTHILCTVKNNISKLYVNGKYVGELSITGTLATDANNFCIGRETYASGHFSFNGKINDVRIYDSALSLKEINEVYKTKILHYSFNECQEPRSVENDNVIVSNSTAGSFNPGWNANLHPHAISVSNWSGGYNGGVPSPEVGYHAHWILDSNKIPNMVFPNLNNSNGLSLGNRWLGISGDINRKLTVSSKTITISWDQKTTDIGLYSTGGPHLRRLTDTAYGFHVGQHNKKNTKVNTWERMSYTFTMPDDLDTTKTVSYYFYGNNGNQGVLYIKNIELEYKDHYTNSTLKNRKGIITDSSGFINHSGEMTSNYPAWSSDGLTGSGCCNFTQNKVVPIPNSAKLTHNQQTISVWLKVNSRSSSSNSGLFGGAHNGAYDAKSGIMFGFESGNTIRCKFYSTTTKVDLTCSVAENNTWIMYTIVINGSNQYVYKNGVKVTSGSVNLTEIDWSGTGQIYLGRTTDFVNINDISIDDFRIYATALSDEDILELYKTRGSVSKDGKVFINEITEKINYAYKINNAIRSKEFKNGLTRYEQNDCKVTLTDDGVRIYRTPNITSDSKTTYGGLRLQLPFGTFEKGKKYKVSFKAKGISANGIYVPNISAQMGWGTVGGLKALNASSHKVIPANFNNNNYEDFWAIFDTTDFDVYQTATKTEGMCTEGKNYNCTRDLAIGFSYANTGTSGTDVYIKDIKIYEIIDDESLNTVNKKGQLISGEINEVWDKQDEDYGMFRLYKNGECKAKEFIEN